MRSVGVFLTFLCGLAALAGCVAIPSETSTDGGPAFVRFGLIAVRQPSPRSESKAVFTSTLGGWATNQGVGLGYRSAQTVELDKACRVVFLIQNYEQLKQSIDLVRSSLDLSKGDICVTG